MSKTPWTCDTNDDYQLMVYDADGNPIAQVISEECEANLRCRQRVHRKESTGAFACAAHADTIDVREDEEDEPRD